MWVPASNLVEINMIDKGSARNRITMQNEVIEQIEDSVENADFNFSDEKVSDNGKFITSVFNF